MSKVITPSERRHPPQRRVGLVRPGVGLGRPPGVRVVLGVALDRGARRAATPGRPASPAGWQATPAPRPRAARARPPTPPRARASASPPGPRRPRRRRRRRAPSARPRSPPTARGGRPASARRASRATHRTDSEAARVVAEPQRPAHRLQRHPQPAVVGLERGQPRRQAVVRGRAAVLELGDRAVGGGALLGVRLERVLAPLRRPPAPVSQGPRARMPVGKVTVTHRRVMAERRRRHWGWGYEDDPTPGEGRRRAGRAPRLRLGRAGGAGAASSCRRRACRSRRRWPRSAPRTPTRAPCTPTAPRT